MQTLTEQSWQNPCANRKLFLKMWNPARFLSAIPGAVRGRQHRHKYSLWTGGRFWLNRDQIFYVASKLCTDSETQWSPDNSELRAQLIAIIQFNKNRQQFTNSSKHHTVFIFSTQSSQFRNHTKSQRRYLDLCLHYIRPYRLGWFVSYGPQVRANQNIFWNLFETSKTTEYNPFHSPNPFHPPNPW